MILLGNSTSLPPARLESLSSTEDISAGRCAAVAHHGHLSPKHLTSRDPRARKGTLRASQMALKRAKGCERLGIRAACRNVGGQIARPHAPSALSVRFGCVLAPWDFPQLKPYKQWKTLSPGSATEIWVMSSYKACLQRRIDRTPTENHGSSTCTSFSRE